LFVITKNSVFTNLTVRYKEKDAENFLDSWKKLERPNVTEGENLSDREKSAERLVLAGEEDGGIVLGAVLHPGVRLWVREKARVRESRTVRPKLLDIFRRELAENTLLRSILFVEDNLCVDDRRLLLEKPEDLLNIEVLWNPNDREKREERARFEDLESIRVWPCVLVADKDLVLEKPRVSVNVRESENIIEELNLFELVSRLVEVILFVELNIFVRE
jgi:hypothetical protein